MATVRGRDSVTRFMAAAPDRLKRVLRGAAREAGGVVMDEAKARVTSDDVREDLTMKSRADGMRIVVRIGVKPGWGRSVGIWLEYGTDPHFISVDDSQRQGMTVKRINTLEKAGTLVIAGQPVGKTVRHPGATPHPFLRVSLDVKEREALTAAQRYIDVRIGPGGIDDAAVPEDEA